MRSLRLIVLLALAALGPAAPAAAVAPGAATSAVAPGAATPAASPVAPGTAASAGSREPVVVLLRVPATPELVRELESAVGALAAVHRFDLVDAVSARATAEQVRALEARPEVERVDDDQRVVPFDSSAQAGFGVTAAQRDVPGLDGDRDGPGYGPDDMVAAVIDSGIDATHPALDGGKVIGFEDLVNGEAQPYDDLGHGTWVAGIAAGDHEDPELRGAAPGAALVGVKVVDDHAQSSLSLIAEGIEWVVEHREQYGIEAINLSIGDPAQEGLEYDVAERAVDAAVADGLVVVAAAGNSGPAARTVKSPGSAAGALTVGAMSDPGSGGFFQGWFSSRGPTADGRVKPDVSAAGLDVTGPARGGLEMTGAGTSAAAPLVTGTALLMLDADPALTPAQVKAAIMGTAQDWGPPGPDEDFGAGRLDAYAALHAAGAALATPPAVPGHLTLSGSGPGVHAIDVAGDSAPVAVTLIGPPGVEVTLRDPGGAVVQTGMSVTRQADLSVVPPGTGHHTLEVSASGPYTLDVSAALAPADAAAPALLLDAPDTPSNDATPLLSGRAGTAPGDFPAVVARLSRGGVAVRTLRALPLPGGAWSARVAPALPDGTYELRAEQGDNAGNVTRTPPATLTIDTTPPQTTIVSGPPGTTQATFAVFAFAAGEAGVRFECLVAPATWSPCGSPWRVDGLGPGRHSVSVRAIDRAGNVDPSPVSRAWTITAPAPPAQTAPPAQPVPAHDPPAAFVAPADVTAPGLGFARSPRALRGGGLALAVRGTEACTVRAELRVSARMARRLGLRATRLAVAATELDAAGVARLRIRPARRVRARLRRVRSLRAAVVVTAEDVAGNARRIERAVRLRR